MVDLGRQPGPDFPEREPHLPQRDAGAGRNGPAEDRGPGAGSSIPGRAHLGDSGIRRADHGRRFRRPREKGNRPGPLAAGHRTEWRTARYKTNLLATPPAGIPPGFIPDDHWFQKLRRSDRASTSNTRRGSNGSWPMTTRWRSRFRSRSAAVRTSTRSRTLPPTSCLTSR